MSAAEKILYPPTQPKPEEAKWPRPARKQYRGMDVSKHLPVSHLMLDQSKPSAVPGMMTSTLRSCVRPGKVEYAIYFVPAWHSFQVECTYRDNGACDIINVPLGFAVQYKIQTDEETTP